MSLAESDSLLEDNVVWSNNESCLQVPLVFLSCLPSVMDCDLEGYTK